MTLRVNPELWQQSAQDLLYLSIHAEHPRTRERFLALYMVFQGRSASEVAREFERHDETVMGWVKLYNEKGPEALTYLHTGGGAPLSPVSQALFRKS